MPEKTFHLAFENDALELMIFSWKEDEAEYFIVSGASKPTYSDFYFRHKGFSLEEAKVIAGTAYVAYLSGLGITFEDLWELPTNTTPKEH